MTNNNRTSRTRIADSEHDGRKPRSIGSLPSVPVEFTDTVGYLPILRATCYTRSLDSLSDMFRSIVLLWLCFLRVTRPEIIPVTAVLHSDPDQLLYVELWLEAKTQIDLSYLELTTVEPLYGDDVIWAGTITDDDTTGGSETAPTTIGPHSQPSAVPHASSPSKPHSSTASPASKPAHKPVEGSTSAPAHATPTAPAHATTTAPAHATTTAPAHTTPTAPAHTTPTAPAHTTPTAPAHVTTTAPAHTTTGAPAPATTTAPAHAHATTTAPVHATTTAPVSAPTNKPPTAKPSSRRHQVRILDQVGAGIRRNLASKPRQTMEIVIFRIPHNCQKNRLEGCDWTVFGVGVEAYWNEDGVQYCCSTNAVREGLCDSDRRGLMIIDHKKFTGHHIKMDVPHSENLELELDKNPIYAEEDSGDYVIAFGNCLGEGEDVVIAGSIVTEPIRGYKLPGELYGLMYFYTFMTIAYFLLNVWYRCGMRIYQDSSIPIQRFIMATLVIGFLEFSVRSMDLGIWNERGLRAASVIWSAVLIGVLRRGITRSLLVMVAMGWGVVRDSLGLAYLKIIFLGLLYCAMSILQDFFFILADRKVETWSAAADDELYDLGFLAMLGVIVINIIFFFWILSSLTGTTAYLENMNQTTKLRRHLRLRCIIKTSFTISIGWVVVAILNSVSDVLTTNQYWMLEGFMHLNDLFVITSVAILWRPNANAKDYAMQLQLATGEDTENELELSCVVPSAEDIDDGDGGQRLRVDDAVVS